MGKQANQDNAGIDGDWVRVAAFAAPHGVKGSVRLKSFTDDATAVFAFTDLRDAPNGKPVKISKERANKDGFVVRVDGVTSPEAAKALKSKQLWVHRDVFAPADDDEFYLADLIGLEARDTDGSRIGSVNAVENFGAEDLIELVLDTPIKGLGRYAFVPFRTELVPDVNIGSGFLTVNMALWQEIQTGKVAESQMNQEDSQ